MEAMGALLLLFMFGLTIFCCLSLLIGSSKNTSTKARTEILNEYNITALQECSGTSGNMSITEINGHISGYGKTETQAYYKFQYITEMGYKTGMIVADDPRRPVYIPPIGENEQPRIVQYGLVEYKFYTPSKSIWGIVDKWTGYKNKKAGEVLSTRLLAPKDVSNYDEADYDCFRTILYIPNGKPGNYVNADKKD